MRQLNYERVTYHHQQHHLFNQIFDAICIDQMTLSQNNDSTVMLCNTFSDVSVDYSMMCLSASRLDYNKARPQKSVLKM